MTLVELVHDVVVNAYNDAPVLAVAVTSGSPKFNPAIVTVVPIDKGPFGLLADVINGASNVTMAPCVPHRPLTVTTMAGEETVLMGPLLQVTTVRADHAVVRQLDLSSANAVAVYEATPKFSPTRLRVVEPETAALTDGHAEETTGAS
jgi:hypothetical protein